MFPGFTPVAMANKAEKPIKDVKPGDIVLSANGRPITVSDVLWDPYDFDVVRVDYQDAGTILATPDQFFVTDRGSIPAASLVVGDRLRTPSYGDHGRWIYWEVEATSHASCDGDVYSLIVNSKEAYVAGGVAVF